MICQIVPLFVGDIRERFFLRFTFTYLYFLIFVYHQNKHNTEHCFVQYSRCKDTKLERNSKIFLSLGVRHSIPLAPLRIVARAQHSSSEMPVTTHLPFVIALLTIGIIRIRPPSIIDKQRPIFSLVMRCQSE